MSGQSNFYLLVYRIFGKSLDTEEEIRPKTFESVYIKLEKVP